MPNCTGVAVVVNGRTAMDHQETMPNHEDHRGKGSDVDDVPMCETSSLGSYGSVMLAFCLVHIVLYAIHETEVKEGW